MGVVYRAVDSRHGREVALKVLPEHLASDEQFRARLQREARLTAQLEDPHVVPIHNYGEIDGRLYLDMRMIRGDTLEELLRSCGLFAPPRAVSVISQVAEALEAAHDAGLLHRDVKPSNVMVVPARGQGAEFVYLTDFGIARAVEASTGSALTSNGATIGTLDYMAPEQFLGRTVDQKVDIYALGCLLYETLTARRPFLGEGLPALMYAHLNIAPPRPSKHVLALPAGLDAVVARAMAKDPNQRFPSTTDLADTARAAITTSSSPIPRTPRSTATAQSPARLPARPKPAVKPPGHGAWDSRRKKYVPILNTKRKSIARSHKTSQKADLAVFLVFFVLIPIIIILVITIFIAVMSNAI
jgi:serine/threonine-protein kinase